MVTLKEIVTDNTVTFVEYRKGNLWYKDEKFGFEFPVPIEDIGDGIFKAKDKAILFMRYIRPYIKN